MLKSRPFLLNGPMLGCQGNRVLPKWTVLNYSSFRKNGGEVYPTVTVPGVSITQSSLPAPPTGQSGKTLTHTNTQKRNYT